MVSLDVTQKFTITVFPAQADGSPGVEDGPPQYVVKDDPGAAGPVLTMIPSADGLSCECRGANAGTTTITPTSTANGAPIVGVDIQVTVTPAPVKFASQLIETIGDVVPQ